MCLTQQQAASGLEGAKSDLASSGAARKRGISRFFCWIHLLLLLLNATRRRLVQGFSMPTPIQEACLMPAIQGRRDIIGAAQTVGVSGLGIPSLLAGGCSLGRRGIASLWSQRNRSL